MAKTYRAPWYVRLANVMMTTQLRAGFKVKGFKTYSLYLLTVRGRKSGQSRSIPLALHEYNGQRYVAASGVTDWVLNLRAAGGVEVLTRERHSETVIARELTPQEAAPILQEEIKDGRHPFASQYGVTANSSLEEFEQSLVGRPMFLLQSVG
ncbi:nitroreductase family deazaflavin-dependent oxidoreductase [Ktedonosporobacter rubrisoli]|uniref:Nitroreductase family deazaflavin-dependent oxidoreductase n=1 Tax=Ktedonosporobacter rubrisoli TaxID=2509675 RepID=A0A4P6JTC5_KTERU|nr:nitroreductase family deazaflavin-dependent oxidoreductase [Ktedonosporobacter rubrisoli]QBD78829.1 nitroreductase family deazaflavin-dependent oxidoreductase [Ktedonosporobacter rubrisoli]